jgi:hypothetical protein
MNTARDSLKKGLFHGPNPPSTLANEETKKRPKMHKQEGNKKMDQEP